jgi:hypothetical protein
MKIKKEYLVLSAIIVVLAVYLATKDRGRVNYTLPELAEIEADGIDRLEIKTKKATLSLVKDADRWRIKPDNYPANEASIQKMTDTLATLDLTAMVSESKNYLRYELDPDNATIVSAFKGDELLRRIEIGKAAASFRHTFVRLTDDHRVYHAAGNFRGDFDQSADDLRDKTVMRLNTDAVVAVTYSVGETELTIKRAPAPAAEKNPTQASEGRSPGGAEAAPQWLTGDGQPLPEAAAAAMDALLRSLAELRCDAFITDKAAADLGAAAAEIHLSGTEDHRLTLYPQDAQGSPAAATTTPYLFRLSPFETKRIMTPFDTLTAEPETAETGAGGAAPEGPAAPAEGDAGNPAAPAPTGG